jgi:hypothetical protein
VHIDISRIYEVGDKKTCQLKKSRLALAKCSLIGIDLYVSIERIRQPGATSKQLEILTS